MIKEYDKNPNVRKVFVVTGAKEREGVTLQQSKEIFEVYGGFSDKVDFIMSNDPTPLTTCYELMKNEKFVNQLPNALFSIGAGDKGSDPARIKQFADYFAKNPNLSTADVTSFPPAKAHLVNGQPASASSLRKAYAEEDWETFKKLLPHESFYDNVVQILNNQGVGRVNENFLLAVPQSFLVEGQKKKKTSVDRRRGHIVELRQSEETPIEKERDETSDEITRFRIGLNDLLKTVVQNLNLPEMQGEERKEFMDSTVATIESMLQSGLGIAEASSMAGGDVEGGGNAWSKKTLIGEEDDE